MYALNNFSGSFGAFSKRAALALLATAALLTGCGGGGDAGEVLPESITITSLDGPSGVTGGTDTTLTVRVTTTGGIGAGEITYTWEQTAGTPVLTKTQSNGDYQSTLTIRPAPVTSPGTSVTFKVTATARGKTSSQSKTVPVNP